MNPVIPIQCCSLRLEGQSWPYAQSRRQKIDRFWKQATSEKPMLFNGTVYMLSSYNVEGEDFEGTLCTADYASMLYWQDQGFPEEAAVRNCFGSAIIRSREGHLLFGKLAQHTANSGRVYPPGGVIDGSDVDGDCVDIDISIKRELAEETGLNASEAERVPGFLMVVDGPRIALAAQFRFDLPSSDLRQRIVSHIEECELPELCDVVVFRRPQFAVHHRMPGFARQIIDHLLPVTR